MLPPGGSCVPGIGIGVIKTYGIGMGVIETNDPGIGIGVIATRPSPIEVARDSVGDVAACAAAGHYSERLRRGLHARRQRASRVAAPRRRRRALQSSHVPARQAGGP
jgi:hypothetical protein